ncbi:MAG: hypothetical protein H0T89_04985, partial [Deltaproteobacteria bacterium]|nr:hypothetical protein [Deltaproteobacteria bacterium]
AAGQHKLRIVGKSAIESTVDIVVPAGGVYPRDFELGGATVGTTRPTRSIAP